MAGAKRADAARTERRQTECFPLDGIERILDIPVFASCTSMELSLLSHEGEITLEVAAGPARSRARNGKQSSGIRMAADLPLWILRSELLRSRLSKSCAIRQS